jgi:hypothetical protein
LSFFNDLNKPVFEVFESGKGGKGKGSEGRKDNEFGIELHKDLPEEKFIDSIVLFACKARKWIPYAMDVNSDGLRKLKATIVDSDGEFGFHEKLVDPESREKVTFLQFAFSKALAGKPGYKQYNYKSPWIVPIQFIDKKQETERQARITVSTMAAGDSFGYNAYAAMQYEKMVENMVSRVSGYRIELSTKVPDFAWYQEAFPNDYSNGQDLPQTSRNKKK